MPPLLETRNLKKYFPVRKGFLMRTVAALRAVDGVSLSVDRGKTLGIVGESGCGKSTLGRTIIRLSEPSAGDIFFDSERFNDVRGLELRQQRRRMQMIFQDPFSSLNPRHTVLAIVREPLDVHNVGRASERQDRVAELLGKVGIKAGHLNRYPHEFSGGQRQRISIARAIALNPDLVVADEPVSALDVSIQAQILNLLLDLQTDLGLTYVFISHDLAVVEHFCNEIMVMYLGRIVERAPRERLFADPRHPYTQALLDAIPIPGRGKRRQRRVLQGDLPSPVAPPKGCAFHTRCPFKKDICSRETPVLKAVGDDREHQTACWLYE